MCNRPGKSRQVFWVLLRSNFVCFLPQFCRGVGVDCGFGPFEAEWIQPLWGDAKCDKYHPEQPHRFQCSSAASGSSPPPVRLRPARLPGQRTDIHRGPDVLGCWLELGPRGRWGLEHSSTQWCKLSATHVSLRCFTSHLFLYLRGTSSAGVSNLGGGLWERIINGQCVYRIFYAGAGEKWGRDALVFFFFIEVLRTPLKWETWDRRCLVFSFVYQSFQKNAVS